MFALVWEQIAATWTDSTCQSIYFAVELHRCRSLPCLWTLGPELSVCLWAQYILYSPCWQRAGGVSSPLNWTGPLLSERKQNNTHRVLFTFCFFFFYLFCFCLHFTIFWWEKRAFQDSVTDRGSWLHKNMYCSRQWWRGRLTTWVYSVMYRTSLIVMKFTRPSASNFLASVRTIFSWWLSACVTQHTIHIMKLSSVKCIVLKNMSCHVYAIVCNTFLKSVMVSEGMLYSAHTSFTVQMAAGTESMRFAAATSSL